MNELHNIFSEKKGKSTTILGMSKGLFAAVAAGALLILVLLVVVIVLLVGGEETSGGDSVDTEVSSGAPINTLTAPSLVGKEWNSELEASINPIRPIVIYDSNSTAPKGQITAQHPAAGTTLYCDNDGICRSMEITVSGREFSTEYKTLVGSTAEDAMAWLEGCGISKANVFRKYKASTTGVGNGCVSAFTYDDGGDVPEGAVLKDTDKFIMTINSYTDSVSVPSLGGKSFEQAVELLYQSKLNIGEISYKESGFADGTVLSQTPATGEGAYYGDKVNLVLSTLAGEFEMPSLLGLTLKEAEELLESHGLELGTVTEESNREYAVGTVCAQSVEEKQGVYAATVIDITLALGGKADDSIDWDADTIIIDISENTHLSAGTVELLAGEHAYKKAFAAAGETYIWSLPIGTAYPEGDEGLELGLLINAGESYNTAAELLRNEGYADGEFLIITSESEQKLPDELTVNVLFGTDAAVQNLRLYYFDSENNEYIPVSNEVYKLSESGYTEIPITEGGTFALVAIEAVEPPAEASEDAQ